jgi:ricin-type beta-trefoil lectin protein
MISTTQRSRLRRIRTIIGAGLVALTTMIGLTAAPAHAAGLVYQGTFLIQPAFSNLCAGTQGNGTARATRIVLQNCDGSSGQRWAIFLATDQNNYWVQAHGGAFPLNMCMDVNFGGGTPTYIWNCNGGSNQRFLLSTTSSSFIFTKYTDNNGQGHSICVDLASVAAPGVGLKIEDCGRSPFISGTTWSFVPA